MAKKRVLALLLMLLSVLLLIDADATKADNKTNADAKEIEYVDYIHRYDYDKEIYPNQVFLTLDFLEEFLVRNSKQVKLEKIKDEISVYEVEKSKESLKDLLVKVDELKKAKRETYRKISDIDSALAADAALPVGHPLKMTPQAKATLLKQRAQLKEAVETYNDNIKEMKENYVLLDFKTSTELLDLSYADISYDTFVETQKLTLNNKILDLLDIESSLVIKVNELDFMKNLYAMQCGGYKLGYLDKSKILEFESKLELLELEIKGMRDDISNKFDELEVLTGLGYIFGIKIEQSFFDRDLVSTSYHYYSDEFQNRSYQFPLIDEQIEEMKSTEKELRDTTSKKLDADILKLRIKNTLLNRDSLVEGVETASFKMMNGYEKIEAEKKKLLLQIKEAERKYSDKLWQYNNGIISKLDLNKANFEVIQLKSSVDIMDLKLLRIKKTLDAMARGIVKK